MLRLVREQLASVQGVAKAAQVGRGRALWGAGGEGGVGKERGDTRHGGGGAWGRQVVGRGREGRRGAPGISPLCVPTPNSSTHLPQLSPQEQALRTEAERLEEVQKRLAAMSAKVGHG